MPERKRNPINYEIKRETSATKVLTKEFLYEKLFIENLSVKQIALLTCIGKSTISRYKKIHGFLKGKDRTKFEADQDYWGVKLIKKVSGKQNKDSKWQCQCFCGNFFECFVCNLRKGNSKSCGCLNHQKGNSSVNWKGYKDLSHTYWGWVKRNAKKRNLSFTITLEEAWNIFEKQNKKCALSGVEINILDSLLSDLQTASLDRIDSNKGYDSGNVQWLHKDVNKMKFDLPQERFVDLCKKIATIN